MSKHQNKALSTLRELAQNCADDSADDSSNESKTGLQGFVHSLMDAHRYVHNRRTAAYPHYDHSEV